MLLLLLLLLFVVVVVCCCCFVYNILILSQIPEDVKEAKLKEIFALIQSVEQEGQATALFDFDGNDSSELTFRAGDQITLLEAVK